VNQKFGITLLIFSTASLLAACHSAASSRLVMERLNQAYSGKPVGDFFASYGKPAGKPKADTYLWVSIQPDTKPSGAPGMHVGRNGQIAFPAHTAKAPGELICQLTIETDKKDAIRSLAITRDSEGEHSNSRCGEIFDPN